MWPRKNHHFCPTDYETSWFSWCVHRKSLDFRRGWEGGVDFRRGWQGGVVSWLQFIVTLLDFGTGCCTSVSKGGWGYCASMKVFDVLIFLSRFIYCFRINGCLCTNILANYLDVGAHVSAAPRVVCMYYSRTLYYFEQILKCLFVLLRFN